MLRKKIIRIRALANYKHDGQNSQQKNRKTKWKKSLQKYQKKKEMREKKL